MLNLFILLNHVYGLVITKEHYIKTLLQNLKPFFIVFHYFLIQLMTFTTYQILQYNSQIVFKYLSVNKNQDLTTI